MERKEKTMEKMIWFDMDGTIANLYGEANWLNDLINERVNPYKNAKPLCNMQALSRVLNNLAKKGYKIGVVSWLSKNGTEEYGARVAKVKKEWLNRHLASVKFDKIDIIKYGEPKENGRNGILFDDEEQNRKNWNGIAYDVNDIIKVLKAL